MANPRIEVELGAVTSSFTSALRNAQDRMTEFATNLRNAARQGLENFGKSLNELAKKLESFGQKSTEIGQSLSLFVTTPILTLGGAALKTASDTEEAFSKFDVVFRDVARSAQESFKTLRNEYGLSSLEAKSLLANTGDLLTGFGFSQESALELSTQVNKLAVDLASFTNFSGGAEGASNALTSALLGEREAIKALGIAILDEDVKRQVAINTAKGLTFETDRQADAYATLELAVKQSANAIGDYERTSDSFANQSRLLGSRLSDLGNELGEVLVPTVKELITFVNGLIEKLINMDSTTKTVVVVVAGLVAAVGPLLVGIGQIIAIIPEAIAGFTALKVAMTGALGPIAIVSAAVVGLAFYVINNFDDIKIASKLLLLDTISFAQNFVKAIDTIVSVLPGFKSITSAAFGSLQVLGQNIAKSLKEDLAKKSSESLEELKDSAKDSVNGIKDSANDLGKSLGLIGTITEKIKNLNESRDLAKDQAEINLIDGKITKLKEQLSLIDAISKRANAPINTGIDTSGLQRPQISTDVNLTGNVSGVNFDGYLAKIQETKDKIKKEQDAILEEARIWNEAISSTISAGLVDAFSGIGTAIGDALATGGNVIKAIGDSLLGSLSKFLGNLGKLLIEYGTLAVVKGKLDLAIKAGGIVSIGAGLAAIAVGVALTAASGALGKFAGSGGNNGSVGQGVAGQSFTGTGVSGASNQNRDISGELSVRGADLVYVFGQAQNKITKG